MFLAIFGLAILAAMFAVFEGGTEAPAAAISPAAGDPGAGSGSPTGGDVSGVSPTGADPAPAASGGDTPAADLGPVPYNRFSEVNERMRRAEEQLSQFTQYEPFIPLVQQLHQHGFTPEQVVQALNGPAQPQFQQPHAPPDPQAEFHAALEARGVDPYSLDANTYAATQMAWEAQRGVQEFRTFQEQQTVRSIEAQLTAEMNQSVQKFPMLQKPEFQRAIYGQWGTQAEAAQSAGLPVPTLAQVAEQFHGAMDAYVKGELARYAAAKQGDATVPVVAGGSAPPPAPTVNFHEASPEERRRMVAEHLAAVNSSV